MVVVVVDAAGAFVGISVLFIVKCSINYGMRLKIIKNVIIVRYYETVSINFRIPYILFSSDQIELIVYLFIYVCHILYFFYSIDIHT